MFFFIRNGLIQHQVHEKTNVFQIISGIYLILRHNWRTIQGKIRIQEEATSEELSPSTAFYRWVNYVPLYSCTARQRFVYGPGKISHKYFILASQYLHENTPHIKSVLLSGPEGSGKTMLVHAICNELKATFFDLTVSLNLGFCLDI